MNRIVEERNLLHSKNRNNFHITLAIESFLTCFLTAAAMALSKITKDYRNFKIHPCCEQPAKQRSVITRCFLACIQFQKFVFCLVINGAKRINKCPKPPGLTRRCSNNIHDHPHQAHKKKKKKKKSHLSFSFFRKDFSNQETSLGKRNLSSTPSETTNNQC